MTPIRIGVVGGGLVGQAVHLPKLARMTDRFDLRALVDPSEQLRQRLSRRFGIPSTYHGWREMVESERLDAIVVCSPNATHAEVAAGALDAGLHVLVEKPLCVAPSDGERLLTLRDRAGVVLQVGYMKRHDPAFLKLTERLPRDPDGLRFIDVVTYDPGLEPLFGPGEIERANDLAVSEKEALSAEERSQVQQAIGSCSPDEAEIFSNVFLGALIHDVNLVHGLLDAMGVPFAQHVTHASSWAGGNAATLSFAIGVDATCTITWLLLGGQAAFREELRVYRRDGVRELRFPAPYSRVRHTPTRYVERQSNNRGLTETVFESYEDAFANELEHFHACIVRGAECKTPAEDALSDQALLTQAFRLVKRRSGSNSLPVTQPVLGDEHR